MLTTYLAVAGVRSSPRICRRARWFFSLSLVARVACMLNENPTFIQDPLEAAAPLVLERGDVEICRGVLRSPATLKPSGGSLAVLFSPYIYNPWVYLVTGGEPLPAPPRIV